MEPKTKTVLMWTVVACLCFVGIPFHLKGEEREMLELEFKNYSKSYNKSYDEDSETETRLSNFKNSVQKIHELNVLDDENILLTMGPSLKGSGAEVTDLKKDKETIHKYVSHKKWRHGMPKNQGFAVWGITEFADMSPEEFKSKYLRPDIHKRIEDREKHHKTHPDPHHHHHGEWSSFLTDNKLNNKNNNNNNLITRKKRALSFAGAIPDKVDWRTKGVITPVLHQKSCGACWAFSTVETVESMRAIQTGKLEALSVQYVIDCATNGNMGCNGGDTCGALQWMEATKLITAAQYPLTLQDTKCRLMASNTGVQINSNYTCDSYVGAEDQLLTVLAHHGPVAAAVDATNWQYYVGGVIQWNCDSNNNHAVQIIGYDKTANPPHYIVRNSWGTAFGDHGYLYVAIGSNLCGIAREVSSLTVEH